MSSYVGPIAKTTLSAGPFRKVLFLFFIFLIADLWGCSVAPSESTVAETITVFLKVGNIEL